MVPTNITKLDLRSCGIVDKDLANALEMCPHLKSLQISQCSRINILNVLTMVLDRSSHFDLVYNKFKKLSIEEITAINTRLSLALTPSERWKRVGDLLPELRRINIARSVFSDVEAFALFLNCPKLQEMDISYASYSYLNQREVDHFRQVLVENYKCTNFRKFVVDSSELTNIPSVLRSFLADKTAIVECHNFKTTLRKIIAQPNSLEVIIKELEDSFRNGLHPDMFSLEDYFEALERLPEQTVLSILRLLRRHDFDFNQHRSARASFILTVFQNRYYEVFRFLLSSGADITRAENSYLANLSYQMLERQDTEMMKIFKEFGLFNYLANFILSSNGCALVCNLIEVTNKDVLRHFLAPNFIRTRCKHHFNLLTANTTLLDMLLEAYEKGDGCSRPFEESCLLYEAATFFYQNSDMENFTRIIKSGILHPEHEPRYASSRSGHFPMSPKERSLSFCCLEKGDFQSLTLLKNYGFSLLSTDRADWTPPKYNLRRLDQISMTQLIRGFYDKGPERKLSENINEIDFSNSSEFDESLLFSLPEGLAQVPVDKLKERVDAISIREKVASHLTNSFPNSFLIQDNPSLV